MPLWFLSVATAEEQEVPFWEHTLCMRLGKATQGIVTQG